MSAAVIKPSSVGSRELVVITKADSGLRATGMKLASVANVDTAPLSAILARHGARMHTLFGLNEERLIAQAIAAPLPNPVGQDLHRYYRVEADDSKLDQLAKDLAADPLVEAAYVKPAGEPPLHIADMPPKADEPPSATPDFTSHEGHLAKAPAGVDAKFASTMPGGTGKNVKIVDCEWAWRFTHEDLLGNQGGVVAGTSGTDTDHGTAVLGVIRADSNGFGVTGIAPDAFISASSFTDQSTSAAIKAAADKLGSGDIILLEIHRPGPNSPNPNQGQLGFIAIEWWPDDFAAIQYAVANGIIVVEAAGNGFQNLDDPIYDKRPAGYPATWKNPFNPANPNSGAVVVGAGAPPSGTHGNDWGPDRSRLDFSNYGSRVDAQGWGREVTTTGYGALQGGSNQDLWYTDGFNGTSSASPVVLGTLASTQGVLRARGHRVLNSLTARRLLRATGSPQADATGRPASQRIGNRPDLRQMIPAAAKFPSRSADFDGDGKAEILATSPWGIGLLKDGGSVMHAPIMAPNGTRFGGWLLNTDDNHFGPAADFDGDGSAETLVQSPWGIGILKASDATLASPIMAANATRFGGWLLNTADNNFGFAGDFDGDKRAEILVTSPWGIGILKEAGSTLAAPVMAPNGTRFGGWLLNTADNTFGPLGDFDGDGHVEFLVTSPWGIGILKMVGSTLSVLMMAPNGTRFGGWLLNTADNTFGPVGDFDGDGHAEIMVSSPWGVGVLKLSGNTFTVPMMAPNGTRFGGWLLNTADNTFGPAKDFDNDRRIEILVTSPWGAGIFKLSAGTFTVPMMAPNGTRFGGWLLNTADNHLASSADYDGDHAAEILATSPWGMGILKLIPGTPASPVMAANGARFDGWLLNTADNNFGHGV